MLNGYSDQPYLSSPALLTPSTLAQNGPLTTHLLTLINPAFKRPNHQDLSKWDVVTQHRFNLPSELIDLLGDQGILAVVFDQEGEEGEMVEGWGKVVACAAVIPWGGEGAEGNRGEREEGWELKVVCVDGGERYAKRGLAGRMGKALEEWIVGREREKLKVRGVVEGRKEVVKLWIQAAECLNGVYWRKRGFTEVRRETQGKGVWGVKSSFELVTMVKDVEFHLE